MAVGSTGGLTIAQLGVWNGGKGYVFVGGGRHCKERSGRGRVQGTTGLCRRTDSSPLDSQMAQPASLENHKKNLDALLSSINAARSLSSHLVDAQTGPGPRSGSVASLPQAVRAQKSLGTSMAMRLKSTFDALKTVEDAMAAEDTQSALSTVRDLSATAPPVAVSRKRK